MSDAFAKLCETVARLRAPDGCLWDREQTNESLVTGLLEETYEAAAAIRANDDANLREELGDVVLLVLMHAQIASEAGRFTIDESLAEANEKLIRRHPHVFGTSDVRDSGAVVRQWDAIKREEKGDQPTHYLGDQPHALPALMRAQKIQSKAARVHFDWNNIADVVRKVDEELAETKEAMGRGNTEDVAEEIGDLLYAVVNLARKSKLDAETLLQAATDKFVRRFNAMEDEVRASGKALGELGLEELDAIWNAHKAARTAPEQ
jgi:MazG family protein